MSGTEAQSSAPVPVWMDLRQQFQEAVSRPAPDRSLLLAAGQAESLTRDLFRDNNTIFFGETHDDVNHKFLADNPGFFREASAQGARHVFVELKIDSAPLFREYAEGRMTTQQLEERFLELNAHRPHTGDTVQSYARQISALAETARDNNMQLVPSDFRLLRDSNFSSDAYGIPDIEGQPDEVRNQTLLSLAEFQQERGARPVTAGDFDRLNEIHNQRIAGLPAETRQRYYQDQSSRSAEWEQNGDSITASIQHNDSLQFNHYSRLVEPGEKSLFFGGSLHFTREATIDNHIEDNGYGRVAGVELRSEAASLRDRYVSELERAENATLPADNDRFDYQIQTERGIVTDQNGQTVDAPSVAPEAPRPERQPQAPRPAAPGLM